MILEGESEDVLVAVEKESFVVEGKFGGEKVKVS